jgi:SPP1 gp7 family putative phage head morphogenesis protein
VTPAERLHDEAVLHRIALSRYSNTTVRRVLAQLNRTEESVLERLARADNEGLQAARLENLLVEIRALQANGWAVVRANLNGDLTALAMAEAEFAAKAVRFGAESAGLQLTTNAPVTAQVVAAVNSRPFQGRLLREWLADAEEGAAKRVREVIRQGFIEGRSISDLVRQIRGTRAAQYRDGILEVSRRGAEAMVRTAVTHTSAAAHQEVYRSFGADVVTGVVWIATLDSRTTELCASRDGKVYPVGSGPRPPAHVNCRSTTAPVIKGLPPIERQSYAAWFAKQPAAVQDDILGKSKGQLYRSGGLPLDRFTDNKGRTLTLQELRDRDLAAFKRAGLD